MLTAILIVTVLGSGGPHIPGHETFGPLAGSTLTVKEARGENTATSTFGTLELTLAPGTYTVTATWGAENCGGQTVGIYPQVTYVRRHPRRVAKITGQVRHVSLVCSVP